MKTFITAAAFFMIASLSPVNAHAASPAKPAPVVRPANVPSAETVEFLVTYQRCLDDIRERFAKTDAPPSFFLHGRKLVIGQADGVYIYTKSGTQVSDGRACLKSSKPHEQKIEDGIAFLMEQLANDNAKGDLPGCRDLKGERIEAARLKLHPTLVLEFLEKKSSPKRAK